MWIYCATGICKRNYGFTILINHERVDLNYGWSYLSLTLFLGCSSFSGGKEVLNWMRIRPGVKKCSCGNLMKVNHQGFFTCGFCNKWHWIW
jgi:hypothetical protein